MSWAEVKKINSDLSVPLDELILSQRKLIPSDKELVRIGENIFFASYSTDITLGTFIPKISGFVNLRLISTTNNDSTRLYIRVYEDETIVIGEFLPDGIGTYDYNLQIKSGKRYRFKFEKGVEPRGSAHYSNISICGEIIEGLMYDFIEGGE